MDFFTTSKSSHTNDYLQADSRLCSSPRSAIAPEQEGMLSFKRDRTSPIELFLYCISSDDPKVMADSLFTRALALGTFNPKAACDYYAQAGDYYSSVIRTEREYASQETHQRAILAHFRAGFYLPDHSKSRTHRHFTDCSALLFNYVTSFRQHALQQGFLVCKALFNRMAYFFETSENLNDKETEINLYLALGELSRERLDILSEKTPQDYLRPAMAYYNAADHMQQTNKNFACYYFELSYRLHSERLNLLGSYATAEDLRLAAAALHNYYILKDGSDSSLCMRFLELELKRLPLLGDQATGFDYYAIAQGYYNLAQCYPPFSPEAARHYDNAVRYQEFCLQAYDLPDPYEKWKNAYKLYSKAAEIFRLSQPVKAAYLDGQANLILNFMNSYKS